MNWAAIDPSVAHVFHAPVTVVGSLWIAVMASFVALEYAGRLHVARDRTGAVLWILAGSITLGSGIWAMHFVGMSAASYPFVATYGEALTAGSWVAAVVVAAVLLGAMTQASLSRPMLVTVAVGGGLGATAMHFIGQNALVVFPAPGYQAGWIVLAVATASAGAGLSLVLFHRLRDAGGSSRFRLQLYASLILGGALTGMHYAAMAAMSYAAGTICVSRSGIEANGLGITVAFASVVVLMLLYLVAHLERRTDDHASRIRGSLDQAREELAFVTYNDPVTGLPNRIVFQDRLDQAVARTARSGESIVVLFVTLDGSSSLGLQGETSGAGLLRAIGALLSKVSRASDTVASIGADQFLVMIEGNDAAAVATGFAERVAEALSEPGVSKHASSLFASIGIATYPQDGPADELVKNAHIALGAAQRDGGNTYRFFESAMDREMKSRSSLLAALRLAAARGELHLVYQPKVYAATGTIAGVEALLRWHHPVRGFVSPALFIPIAEEYGLIDEIGQWVLVEAARQMNDWSRQNLRVRVAINVSTRQLRHPALADDILATLHRYDVDPALLTCEVTESGAMQDPVGSLAIFERLAAAGVRLSIDDFGTGYSSLSHLSRLPVHQLKIDRSFVVDLERGEQARAIVATIVQLARTLGLEVVAEGVETEAQRRVLEALGCDKFQGYLFARPMGALDLTALLRVQTPRSPLFNESLVVV